MKQEIVDYAETLAIAEEPKQAKFLQVQALRPCLRRLKNITSFPRMLSMLAGIWNVLLRHNL